MYSGFYALPIGCNEQCAEPYSFTRNATEVINLGIDFDNIFNMKMIFHGRMELFDQNLILWISKAKSQFFYRESYVKLEPPSPTGPLKIVRFQNNNVSGGFSDQNEQITLLGARYFEKYTILDHPGLHVTRLI